MKKTSRSMLLSSIICALPVIPAALYYPQLPEQIPIHFDSAGEPNNFAPKLVACFLLPLALVLLNLFVHFSLNTDPKGQRSSTAIKAISKWLIPAISVIVNPISLFYAMGTPVPVHIIVPCFVGVLIVVMGNYLPKSRQNYTVGIRLPWTLNNEDNWNKTHWFAGVVYIIGGFSLILASLLQFYPVVSTVVVIVLLVAAPFLYSYLLYRKSARQPLDKR